MNTDKLVLLPEAENKYRAHLSEGEKVVFAARVNSVETTNMQLVGSMPAFTMTNRRFFINNGNGIWDFELETQVSNCTMETRKFLFIEQKFFLVAFDRSSNVDFGGVASCDGFRVFMNKKDTEAFSVLLSSISG